MKFIKSKILKFLPWIVLMIAVLFAGFFFRDKIFKRNVTIPIAMALDDGYVYPTIVAMTSMLENASKGTKYDYYIMHPAEFKEENKEKIKSLEKKYPRCSVNLIDMEDKFKNANDKGHITTPAYYRLALSDILPKLDKIIWLDGDTLTFGDLKKMYDIDMKGYYYKGILDNNVKSVEEFVHNDHCICSGVMLVNLKELRENDMVNKFSKFIEENNARLKQHDQTVINAVCVDKVGVLPLKYGVFNYYYDEEAGKEFIDCLIAKDKYTEKDLKDAFKHLCIVHCVCKPWKHVEYNFVYDWWKYAKMTDFYSEICDEYPVSKLIKG